MACPCTIHGAGTYTLGDDLNPNPDGFTCLVVQSDSDNAVINCDGHNITGPGDFGVVVYANGVTLEGCNIHQYGKGIVTYGNNTIITNNRMTEGDIGIDLESNGNRVTGNNASHNGYPLVAGTGLIVGGSNNVIENNYFDSNWGGTGSYEGGIGIDIEGSSASGNNFTNNEAIGNNYWGVYLGYLTHTDNRFTGNTATGNPHGDFKCNSASAIDGDNICSDDQGCSSWLHSC